MATARIGLEGVLELAKCLTPLEKVRLVEQIIPDLEAPLETVAGGRKPLQSAYGICAHLGTAPSEEEIGEVRAEMFDGFPRDDVT